MVKTTPSTALGAGRSCASLIRWQSFRRQRRSRGGWPRQLRHQVPFWFRVSCRSYLRSFEERTVFAIINSRADDIEYCMHLPDNHQQAASYISSVPLSGSMLVTVTRNHTSVGSLLFVWVGHGVPTRIPHKQVVRDAYSSSEYDTCLVVRRVHPTPRKGSSCSQLEPRAVQWFIGRQWHIASCLGSESKDTLFHLHLPHDFSCFRQLSSLLLRLHTRLGRVGQHLTHRCS